jgi:hypothetical protein
MTFGCNPNGQSKKKNEGEGGGFPPNSNHGEFYESMYARGLSMHQKCSNYAFNQLVVWFVQVHMNN